jgi:hypothetical protein
MTPEAVDPRAPAPRIRVREALRGSREFEERLEEFVGRCAPYFEGDGRLIDQAYQPRLADGVVTEREGGDHEVCRGEVRGDRTSCTLQTRRGHQIDLLVAWPATPLRSAGRWVTRAPEQRVARVENFPDRYVAVTVS